jgi:hypothetical protein
MTARIALQGGTGGAPDSVTDKREEKEAELKGGASVNTP